MDFIVDHFPIVFMIFLGFAGVIGIAAWLVSGSIKRAPVVTRFGRVIEKVPGGGYEMIVVEFPNGQRERLVNLKHVALVVGDTGIFKTQKNAIIEFQRRQGR